MALDFARSQRSTIGVEWELQILDPAGDLSPVAPQLLQEVEHRAQLEIGRASCRERV